MKKFVLILLGIVFTFLVSPLTVYAADASIVGSYTTDILNILTVLGALVVTIFLIKGGFTYITSTGHPESLQAAKKTIINSLIGLVLVVGASTVSGILSHSFTTPINSAQSSMIVLTPIQPKATQSGLTQMMINSYVGMLQNIVQSATKPVIDGVISFLTVTPSLVTNSVVFNFWLVILGITDSLFAIMIALLGFHFMSSSALGFEDVDLKQVMSRIILTFLAANTSIFLIDRIIVLCNTLIQAVLSSTGGIAEAWVLNAFNAESITTGNTPLVTLIFMCLFVMLAVVLLLSYISRLIVIALGAVLSPIVFLLWTLPATADFAKIAVKSYIVTIFIVFVHVVTIQIASSFLSVTQQTGTNSLISIFVAIGLFFTLLKLPGSLFQMAFYTSMNGAFRKVGGQVMNVISSSSSEQSNQSSRATNSRSTRTPARKVAL